MIATLAPLALQLPSKIRSVKWSQVAVGDAIAVARSAKGDCISWGAFKIAPWRVDPLFPKGEKCKAIAAGGPFCLAVTSPSGLVFTWSRCALEDWSHSGPPVGKRRAVEMMQHMDMPGFPPELIAAARNALLDPPASCFKRPEVQQVSFLSNIQQVACSSTHGVALSEDGRLYVWPITATSLSEPTATDSAATPMPAAGARQLAMKPAAAHPFEVALLRGRHVKHIACGDDFVVVATQPPLNVQPALPDVGRLTLEDAPSASSSGSSGLATQQAAPSTTATTGTSTADATAPVGASTASATVTGVDGAVLEELGGMKLRLCAACGRYEEVAGSFKLCASCKQVFYCGAECQRADWRKGHKKACKAATAAAAVAAAE